MGGEGSWGQGCWGAWWFTGPQQGQQDQLLFAVEEGPTCGPFPYSSILHPYRFPPPSQGLAIPTSSACPSSSSHFFYTTLALVNCLFLKPP